jgi:hypothetical protein
VQEHPRTIFNLMDRKYTGRSFREKDRLALLLLPYRPLRVCSVVAPSDPAFLTKTASLGFFNGLQGVRRDFGKGMVGEREA